MIPPNWDGHKAAWNPRADHTSRYHSAQPECSHPSGR